MLYSVVFVFLLVNALFSKRIKGRKAANNWFFISSLLVLGIIAGCRFQVGATSDMYRYYMHTYRSAFTPWKDILTPSLEYLNRVVMKISVTVFCDPQAYFFITAFFISGVQFIVLRKYSQDPILGVFLFFVGSYFSANNLTRQYVAVAITYISVKYIIENKPWKFFLCILLALGFHASAIVAIPLFFLSKRKFTKNHLIGYVVLGVFIVVFNRQVTNLMQLAFYSHYGEGYGSNSSNVLRLVWPAFSFLCLMITKAENCQFVPEILQDKPDQITRFNNLVLHGTIMSIYFSLLSATSLLLFSRVSTYFGLYNALNEMYGIKASSSGNTRRAMTLALWGLLIAWFIVMNYSGKYIPTPYTPFWEFPWRAIP